MKEKQKKLGLLIFCGIAAIVFLILALDWILNDYFLGIVKHGKMQYAPNLFAYLKSSSSVASKYGVFKGYSPIRALIEAIIFSVAFVCFTFFSFRIYFQNFKNRKSHVKDV